MTRTKGPMRWAGVFAAASALLHVVALVFGGNAMTLLIYAVLYAALAFGLLRGMRWVGYIAFIVLFIGVSIALGGLWSTGPVPGWLFAAIAGFNLAAVLSLFVSLWRSPTQLQT